MSFIWEVPGLLSPSECEEFVGWAERIPRDAEDPQPVIRVVEGEPHRPSGAIKVENALRHHAGSLGVATYEGPARMQVLHYREGNRVPWHPDFRPGEVNFKVTVSVCLRPGSHVLEYVTSSGVVQFFGSSGDAVLFPSWVAHRVVPLERYSSDRWSLAAWLRGPEYV